MHNSRHFVAIAAGDRGRHNGAPGDYLLAFALEEMDLEETGPEETDPEETDPEETEP